MTARKVCAHISTLTTTTVPGQDVLLWAVNVNKLGTTGSTATITDTASGQVLAVIDTTVSLGQFLFFGVRCQRGFTVVTATGVAGDLTVIYE